VNELFGRMRIKDQGTYPYNMDRREHKRVHLTESDILLYVENKLPAEDRRNLEQHVGRCDNCARQFATLVRLPHVLKEGIPIQVGRATLNEAAALVGGGKQTSGWTFRIFSSPFRAALAGVSVLAITLTTYLLIPRPEPAQFRSTDSSVPMLKLFPHDGARITGPHPEFRWSPVARSSVYKFSLMDENGVSVWNWDVRDTSLLLPSPVVLIPGKTYLWRVESFLANKSLERSALHVFTYAPSH